MTGLNVMHYEVTVRLYHTDAAGVLFYGRIFEIVEEAFEEALAKTGLPLGDLLQDRDLRIPVVHAEADYITPVRVGDKLRVTVDLEAGRCSMRVKADIADLSGRSVTKANIVHVAVDGTTGKAIPLPRLLYDAIDRISRPTVPD